jgi:3-hydroxyacyl-CoA dehydrogenase/enoyl-CoA hydratase/3-hydroxybutyryl-CoA epimerase
VRDVVRERQKRRQITRLQMDDFLSQVGVTTDYSGFESAQLVIEAVFEDLAVKQQVLREVEAVAAPRHLRSNTSTIPIREIAAASHDPGRSWACTSSRRAQDAAARGDRDA